MKENSAYKAIWVSFPSDFDLWQNTTKGSYKDTNFFFESCCYPRSYTEDFRRTKIYVLFYPTHGCLEKETNSNPKNFSWKSGSFLAVTAHSFHAYFSSTIQRNMYPKLSLLCRDSGYTFVQISLQGHATCSTHFIHLDCIILIRYYEAY
jgi:hypothetical protein